MPSGSLWDRLLATFTRPGELTVAVDPPPELVQAAAVGGHKLTALVTHPRRADRLGDIVRQASAPHRRARLRIQQVTTAQLRDMLTHAQATVGLLVLPASARPRLIGAAAEAVPAGRHLVLAADERPGQWALSETQRHTLAATGLRYLQHIVAVEAAIDADTWAPAAPARRLPAGRRHRRIHHDWYVYTRPGGAP